MSTQTITSFPFTLLLSNPIVSLIPQSRKMRQGRNAYSKLSQSSIQPLLDDFDAKDEVSKTSESFNSANSSSILLPFHILDPRKPSNLIHCITLPIRRPFSVIGSAFLTAFGIFGMVVLTMYVKTSFHPQPSYNILSKSDYRKTLLQSIQTSFPVELQPHLQARLESSLDSNNHSLISPLTPEGVYSPKNSLSGVLWQTDKTVLPDTSENLELRDSWQKAGIAETIFMDDDEALNRMKDLYDGSQIFNTYCGLPVPVLKADMLRYSLLLASGGIYSDVDTKALMPIESWKKGSKLWIGQGRAPVQLPDNLDKTSSIPKSRLELINEASPVRLIISIEGTNYDWDNYGNFLRWAHLKIFTRHREVQFVQWTIQSSTYHPILLDTLRRVINTDQIARGMVVEKGIKIGRAESSGDFKKAEKIRKEEFPWDGVHGKEFELTGVEEYTGPGTWSDSVLSYLYAISDISIRDLRQLNHPLQVGDVLILPTPGFNPARKDFANPMARVGHLYRGSWK